VKILVVGGGGREHALAWRLARDTGGHTLFCAPGNAGTEAVAVNLPIGADDLDGLTAWARSERPDLTVVGPEAPLCAGLADRLSGAGLCVFGPTQAAARLEGSKAFAKEIMEAAGVPTARARTFDDADAALAYVREAGAPLVVKADGLAAGKGVLICATQSEAENAVRRVMVDGAFGSAGQRVVVEECLVGEEASILALIDGEHVVMLASSQDHKRAYNGDTGPNTGGMGAYSPAPVVTDALWPAIRATVFDPTLAELRRRGIVYRGVLYAGLMLTADGPRVLEFNCRFGDPETQAIVPRLRSDLAPALLACTDGTLSDAHVQWRDDACVCVVMAAGGYPGAYEKGREIRGLDSAGAEDGVAVFHAGTACRAGRVVTAGGRVLGVTALGDGLHQAVQRAYRAVSLIAFDQAQYRTDIAARALERARGAGQG
jgi:phosphoribosylamine---glycine ligase